MFNFCLTRHGRICTAGIFHHSVCSWTTDINSNNFYSVAKNLSLGSSRRFKFRIKLSVFLGINSLLSKKYVSFLLYLSFTFHSFSQRGKSVVAINTLAGRRFIKVFNVFCTIILNSNRPIFLKLHLKKELLLCTAGGSHHT